MRHALTVSFGLAALNVALAGCGSVDDLQPQTFAEKKGDNRDHSLGRGRHNNADHYSDHGHHATQGNSHSFIASAQALLAKSGITTLIVTANGSISKVDVNVLDGGRTRGRSEEFTKLSGSMLEFSLTGLIRGEQLQVDVSGKDGKREEHVRLIVTVVNRPDLAPVSIDALARVAVHESILISAQVSELALDLGGTADCVLRDDGVEVDRAYAIFVDAGDTVTCAFRHRFDEVSTRTVSVSLEDVVPADYDPANNSASVSIEVVPTGPIGLVGSMSDLHSNSSSLSEGTFLFADGFGHDFRSTMTSSTHTQVATVSGTRADAGLAFPLERLTFNEVNEGSIVKTASYEAISADSTTTTFDAEGNATMTSCAARSDSAENSFASVCSTTGGDGSRSFSVAYSRFAQTVVYHSTQFDRFFAPDGNGTEYTDSTDTSSAMGSFTPVGANYGFEVSIIDGDSAYYTDSDATPTFPVDIGFTQPYSCSDFTDSFGTQVHSCSSSSSSLTGRASGSDGGGGGGE